MKTLIAAVFGIAALGASATTTITDVIVRQQWPWNGKVNIDYVLTDPEDGEHDITVVMSNGTQVVTNEYGSLSGDLFGVKPGARRIVWNPMHNNPTYAEKVLASFSVTLSTSDDSSGQYMVLDLSGGAGESIPVEFVSAPPAGGWNQDIYKTTKLVLRRIPAGTFRMGSPEGELGRNANRETQHTVLFTNDFYIGMFEMTHAQYSNIVHTAVEYSAGTSGSTYPVNFVTLDGLRGSNADSSVYPAFQADSFIGRLNSKFSFTGDYADYTFDLPTLSQWEYACRAGTAGAWNDGTTITNTTTDAQLGGLAWYRGNTYLSPYAVGGKKPNAFGLYDMHGNVAEICIDRVPNSVWWSDATLVEPIHAYVASPWGVVNKGGGADFTADICRSASAYVGNNAKNVGFRIVFVPRHDAGVL